jgi:CBS domain containing-hemolysin-like protein
VTVTACVLGVVSRADSAAGAQGAGVAAGSWTASLPVSVLLAVCCFLTLSAFFSASETALFSIQKHRLRVLRSEQRWASRLLVRMLERPGQLLTTILVGNMLVNTLIAVLLGRRVENLLERAFDMPKAASYALAVVSCTAVLVFFGEITPKIFAVHAGEAYARVAVAPLAVLDRILAPICRGLLRITEFLFLITRFHELHAAPYITDEELKSLVSTTDADDAAEKEGRRMIRRILEFQDVMLREILVPRPDVVALPDTATVAQARDRFREHEYSRMPVYRDDLDHIVGILFVKDVLPSLVRGDLDRPVKDLVRKAHFVPETLGVQGFVKDVQRLRSHLAIVVDEYGGTEGIVTLEDAITVVVGTLPEEDETQTPEYACIADGVYRLDGAMPLGGLGELTGIPIEDKEHESLSGFLMSLSGKILEAGDHIEHAGVRFTVEAVDGRRAATVRMEIPREQASEETNP